MYFVQKVYTLLQSNLGPQASSSANVVAPVVQWVDRLSIG